MLFAQGTCSFYARDLERTYAKYSAYGSVWSLYLRGLLDILQLAAARHASTPADSSSMSSESYTIFRTGIYVVVAKERSTKSQEQWHSQ